MTVIVANVFLYAYNADAPQQWSAAQWLQELLASGETIALPWVTIWAFIRIGTDSRIWANPRPASEAFAIVREWLGQPGVVSLHPGPLHAEILERLVNKAPARAFATAPRVKLDVHQCCRSCRSPILAGRFIRRSRTVARPAAVRARISPLRTR